MKSDARSDSRIHYARALEGSCIWDKISGLVSNEQR